jgi:pyruvate/2-oxoglutarate dehydrogenase complex dihydrolipoamide dehydrogenase (E3) component
MGLNLDGSGRVRVNSRTLASSRPGVFAGGDLTTGPNTVVEAIAAGRKAARSIDLYLRGESLETPCKQILPSIFIPPAAVDTEALEDAKREECATLPIADRRKSFDEVDMALSADQAAREARRCLRCDLRFTQSLKDLSAPCVAGEEQLK